MRNSGSNFVRADSETLHSQWQSSLNGRLRSIANPGYSEIILSHVVGDAYRLRRNR